ncbi:collagen alpha-2(I) chain-like [Passer montanus]|uniref:collagen alpha-2(I) chain-like n=1 Tax=Passer montanus TaxID=9160 RepID=UPI001960CD00|nr:collagen alpha-2(I) chain-like [Passer montanus]
MSPDAAGPSVTTVGNGGGPPPGVLVSVGNSRGQSETPPHSDHHRTSGPPQVPIPVGNSRGRSGTPLPGHRGKVLRQPAAPPPRPSGHRGNVPRPGRPPRPGIRDRPRRPELSPVSELSPASGTVPCPGSGSGSRDGGDGHGTPSRCPRRVPTESPGPPRLPQPPPHLSPGLGGVRSHRDPAQGEPGQVNPGPSPCPGESCPVPGSLPLSLVAAASQSPPLTSARRRGHRHRPGVAATAAHGPRGHRDHRDQRSGPPWPPGPPGPAGPAALPPEAAGQTNIRHRRVTAAPPGRVPVPLRGRGRPGASAGLVARGWPQVARRWPGGSPRVARGQRTHHHRDQRSGPPWPPGPPGPAGPAALPPEAAGQTNIRHRRVTAAPPGRVPVPLRGRGRPGASAGLVARGWPQVARRWPGGSPRVARG